MKSSYKGDMTISRQLGHKNLIPGSGQWKFNKKNDPSSCWYCGNWMLSIIMWNQ